VTSFPLSAFVATVQVLIKASDSTEDLSSTDLQTPIKDALASYGGNFPDTKAVDVTGDGGIYYDFASFTGWSDGFSQVLSVEYPAATIASDETPTFLDNTDYDTDYWSGTTRYLRFINASPAATEAFRIRFTLPYAFSGTVSAVDIPNEHYYPLCKLAACYACRAIAAKFSRIGDSPLGVDSAANTTKAQEFNARGDTYCASYRLDMGLPAADATTGRQKAASAFANLDTAPEWQPGRQYVFHRGR
jgi:hypothetical protein